MAISAKQLLLAQTARAFSGSPDMSLKSALSGVTQAEADWRPSATTPTVEEIVRHIAWSKSKFCHDGFATPMILIDPAVNDAGDHADLACEFPCGAAFGRGLASGIDGAIKLLDQSQQVFVACLESCTDESLDQPIPTHHGKSATNFFTTMLMHDLYHAGTIRTRRTMCRLRA
jgi:DinB superfamily